MDADGVARRVTFFGGRRSRVETHNSSAWRAAGMWTLTSCAVLKILSETTSSTVAQGRGARVVRDAGPRSAAPDHEDEGLNSVKRRPHPEEARKRGLEGWIETPVKAATPLALREHRGYSISREAASRVRSHISPGPYRSFRELSLAGSVDPGIWCPPTFVGNSGIECFNGVGGFALSFRFVIPAGKRVSIMSWHFDVSTKVSGSVNHRLRRQNDPGWLPCRQSDRKPISAPKHSPRAMA